MYYYTFFICMESASGKKRALHKPYGMYHEQAVHTAFNDWLDEQQAKFSRMQQGEEVLILNCNLIR